MERRLQTVVLRKGLARTPHQARQLITHGHIAIGNNRVTIPSYTVTRDEESLVKMVEGSTFVLQEIAVPKPKDDTYGNPDEKEELESKEKPVEEEKTETKEEVKEKPVEEEKTETKEEVKENE